MPEFAWTFSRVGVTYMYVPIFILRSKVRVMVVDGRTMAVLVRHILLVIWDIRTATNWSKWNMAVFWSWRLCMSIIVLYAGCWTWTLDQISPVYTCCCHQTPCYFLSLCALHMLVLRYISCFHPCFNLAACQPSSCSCCFLIIKLFC